MNSLITIEEYDKNHLAQVAVFALEQAGIQCFLQNETIVAMDWFIANAVGGIQLQVATEDVAEAQRVLSEIREKRNERDDSRKDTWVAFRCATCKKSVAFSGISLGRVESCPKCGNYVDVPVQSDPELDEVEVRSTIETFRSDSNPLGTSFLSSQSSYLWDAFYILCILASFLVVFAAVFGWI